MADKNGQGEVTAEKLQKEFEKNGRTDVQASGENPIIVTFESGREYTIDENGKISDPVETSIMATIKIEGTKVTQEEVEDNIPEGFYHVGETKIEDGLVISSVEGDDLENSKGGNQFVWVPVDRNQKIKINVTSKAGNIESISLTDPYGDEKVAESNVGTSYSNAEVGTTINGTYKLTVVAGGETKEVELKVNSLYAQRMWELEKFTDEVAKKLGYENAEEFYSNSIYASSGMSLEQLKSMMPSMFKSTFTDPEDKTNSVNTYGGFYIGRYEASYENGNAVSKKTTATEQDNRNSVLVNGKLWNFIEHGEAKSAAEAIYPGKSSLLTGAAWDRTLSWLKETGVVEIEEIVGDSKSWGNYDDDSFSNTTGLINTGEYSETEKNHIYDLAGNLMEWTTEVYSTDDRIVHGRLLQRQWL